MPEFRGVCRSQKVRCPILLKGAGIQCRLYCKGRGAAKLLCALRLLGPHHEVGKRPHVGRQIMVNQSHTNYVLRGYLFWGVKLTHTINHQEGSLVAGAGAGSMSRNHEPEPSTGTKRQSRTCRSSFKEEYQKPHGGYPPWSN